MHGVCGYQVGYHISRYKLSEPLLVLKNSGIHLTCWSSVVLRLYEEDQHQWGLLRKSSSLAHAGQFSSSSLQHLECLQSAFFVSFFPKFWNWVCFCMFQQHLTHHLIWKNQHLKTVTRFSKFLMFYSHRLIFRPSISTLCWGK